MTKNKIHGNSIVNNNPEELHTLRTYLWAKTLWNPDLDVNTVIKEFVEDYYGKAAPAIMEYIAFRDKVNQKIDKPVTVFIHNAPWISDEDILKIPEFLIQIKSLVRLDLKGQL